MRFIIVKIVITTLSIMNERLSQFLAAENISQSQFADSIGVARASISHIVAGRNKPGYDFICSVMERYPSLNIEWLLAGKGKMYKGAAMEKARNETVENQVEKMAEVREEETDLFSAARHEEELKASQAAPDLSAQMPADTLRRRDLPLPQTKLPYPPESGESADAPAAGRRIDKIVVFYSDSTFQEIKA